MALIRSHWAWLAAILTVWSAWDYYDHIARPGSAFEQAPGDWFGFTFASLVSVLAIARLGAWALDKARVPELAAASVGMGCAVAAHLLVTGPLWDRVFWQGNLIFNAVMMPVLIAVLLYLFYRAMFAFLVRVIGSSPPSRG